VKGVKGKGEGEKGKGERKGKKRREKERERERGRGRERERERERETLNVSNHTKHIGCQFFLATLLSDWDSIYSRKPLFDILETPLQTCLICTGTPVTTCWKIRQS